jgi:hypothetical protein
MANETAAPAAITPPPEDGALLPNMFPADAASKIAKWVTVAPPAAFPKFTAAVFAVALPEAALNVAANRPATRIVVVTSVPPDPASVGSPLNSPLALQAWSYRVSSL